MIPQIQFLRFFVFVLVFGQHLYPYATDGFPWAAGAHCAVSFFFIASGYCSGFSHAQLGFRYDGFWSEYGHDLLKKFKKLYPLFFVSNVLWLFIPGNGIPGSSLFSSGDLYRQEDLLKGLFNHLLFTRPWRLFGFEVQAYNPVLWFVSTLAFLYLFRTPFLKFLDCLAKRFRVKGLWVVTLLALAGLVVYTITIVRYPGGAGFLYGYPPARLFDYLAGMAVGMIVQSHYNAQKPVEVAKVRWWTTAEVLTLALWIACLFIPFNGKSWDEKAVRWVMPNVALLCVYTLSRGELVKWILSHKFLTSLGALVMPCYCFHAEIRAVVGKYLPYVEGNRLSNLVVCALCALATVCVASMVVEWKNKRHKLISLAALSILLLLVCGHWLSARRACTPLQVVFERQDLGMLRKIKSVTLYYLPAGTWSWSGQKKITARAGRVIDNNTLQVLAPKDAARFWLVFNNVDCGSYSNLPRVVKAQFQGKEIPLGRFKEEYSSKHKFSSYKIELE